MFFTFPEVLQDLNQLSGLRAHDKKKGMIYAPHLVLVIWELQLLLQLFPLFMLSLQILFLGVDLRLKNFNRLEQITSIFNDICILSL